MFQAAARLALVRDGFDITGFLREPRRPASVSTVTPSGRPALATMWFGLFDGRLWFHTPGTGRQEHGTPHPVFLDRDHRAGARRLLG